MYPEPFEHSEPDASGPLPSAALRERVLCHCRRAMEEHPAARRRRARRWQWGLAAGAAALLLVNAIAEHQTSVRIAQLEAGRAPVALARSLPPAALGALRARRLLLAALLRDPNSL